MIGQDECIYKQFLLNNMHWVAGDGTAPLLPKDEGQGIMFSAFVSRDFGFGYSLSAEEIKAINDWRSAADMRYKDGDAAKRLNGHDKKIDLTSSPFVRSLDYGKHLEGYWGYDNMVL